VQVLKADSAVVSLAMDDLNNEGLAGTANGSIFYLNFAEKLIIKIVSKAYHLQKEVSVLKVCEHNP
jgi:streptogramin lyase